MGAKLANIWSGKNRVENLQLGRIVVGITYTRDKTIKETEEKDKGKDRAKKRSRVVEWMAGVGERGRRGDYSLDLCTYSCTISRPVRWPAGSGADFQSGGFIRASNPVSPQVLWPAVT